MTRLATFLALPAADRRLLVEAFALLIGLRLALRLVAVERLRRAVAPARRGAPAAERIAWAVQVAARRLPGTSCLASALAAQRLLARHGHVSELTIGVARNPAGFAAHAWLAFNGEILIGGEEQPGFTRLMTWTSDATSPRRAVGDHDQG